MRPRYFRQRQQNAHLLYYITYKSVSPIQPNLDIIPNL